MSSPEISEMSNLLINHNYARLWSGNILSVVGDAVLNTTLTLWVAVLIVKGQPWGPLAVGGLGIATNIPTFVVGSLAGVFVDRWDKRKTLLWMDALRAILVFLLLLAIGPVPLPIFVGRRLPLFWLLLLIYAIVFFTSSCNQFFNQARLILIGDLVDEAHFARASALLYGTLGFSLIVGPPLASLLLFRLGIQWALLFDALSFVPSFVAILFLRVPRATTRLLPENQDAIALELREGVRFFMRSRVLRAALISILLFVVGEATFNILGVFFLPQNLHTSSDLFGLIGTAFGAGALLGTALVSPIIKGISVTKFLCFSLLMWGGLAVVLARQNSFVPALITYFLLGLPYAGVNVVLGPLLLQFAPRKLGGRVTSIFIVCMGVTTTTSMALVGYIDSTLLQGFHARVFGVNFGAIDTLFTIVDLLGLIAGAFLLINLHSPPPPTQFLDH